MKPNDLDHNCCIDGEKVMSWRPINTAPRDVWCLVTAGGLPGAMEIVIARLREDLGRYQWQFLGPGGPFGGAKYWMDLPEVPA